MPKLNGPKAFSLTGVLRDQDDQEEYSPPESGINYENISDEELLPHYYSPNFLRPLPEEEPLDDPLGDDLDVSLFSNF